MSVLLHPPQFLGSTFATANAAVQSPALPPPVPVFDAQSIELQRRMRFNPLRALDPANLSIALDQFDMGILRQAALLWDAMIRRDDTLSFVVPQLENAIAGKPWGVFKKKNADPVEAARHAAALEYFYASVTAVDAFDRNVRGDRHLLLKQMGAGYALRYAVHHFVWQPQPGRMIEVEGAAPVPALTATLEFVPLWFFENVSGTLRFLPFGGFGIHGQELDWNGEWMVTTGQGLMFAASICYVFKRLAFQDWTVFNERYAQQKVVGMTNAQKDSEPGQAMASIVENFNSDQGIVLYETQAGDKPPISLLGPEGSVSVDLFERFLDRQDEKMTVMFRGSAQANAAAEKKDTGITAQILETEALELAHCAAIASACRTYIDRAVIRYCFGEGVEPLAYFGLPDMDEEDATALLAAAGFLADRGALVEADTAAERLGITLTTDPAKALRSLTPPPADPNAAPDDPVLKRQIAFDQYKRKESTTANAGLKRLEELVVEALATANAAEEGHWVTIEGRHVKLDKDGHVLEGHLRGGKSTLSEGNPLHSGSKSDIVKAHGNDSRTTRDHPGNGSPGGGGAEKRSPAKADHSGSGARASAGVFATAHKSLSAAVTKSEKAARGEEHKAGREHLAAARASGALPTTQHNPALRLAEGGEHHVELSTDGARVIKHTKGGLFGYQPDVNSGGNVVLRASKASEYLDRNTLQNKAFGSDLRLEGSHEAEGGGLTVSQTHFTGEKPSHARIEDIRAIGGDLPMATTSIYSRTDGIVHWRTSRARENAQTENIEILLASHTGLGFHPAALWAIADRLAQAEGHFAPFAKTGPFVFAYGRREGTA